MNIKRSRRRPVEQGDPETTVAPDSVATAIPNASEAPIDGEQLDAAILRALRERPNRTVDMLPLADELKVDPFRLQLAIEDLGRRRMVVVPFIEPGTAGGATLTAVGLRWLIAREGGSPADTPVAAPSNVGNDQANGNGSGNDSHNGERNVTPAPILLAALFRPALSAAKSVFPVSYRDAHWAKVIAGWDVLEADYTRRIASWMFAERSRELELLVGAWKTGKDEEPDAEAIVALLLAVQHWKELADAFAAFSREVFAQALELTEESLTELFADLGVTATVDLAATEAAGLLEARATRVKGLVTETLRVQVRAALAESIARRATVEQTAEAVRAVFAVGKNRAREIARTELGGAFNDGRIAGFKAAGLRYHSWLTARDAHVRETHRIDGEIAAIGERFSNGLLYPHDPEAPAEEVCGCRCLTLPELGGRP